MHLRSHGPAHHLAAEQVDDHRQEQPAFLGGNVRDITSPGLVGPGRSEVTVQQVRRDRQVMLAIGGHHPETPLAASSNAVFLHQSLHPLFAHANAALDQLPPDARPTVGAAMFRVHRADMRQQRGITQMPPRGDLPPPHQMLMKAGHAHYQHPALHTDRPDPPMAFDEGILYFWPFAKYAVAFPRMSRSIVTRASSARKRAISICSAVTPALPMTSFNFPARFNLTQFESVCSTTPRLRAASAMPWPDSTSRTASSLNSSVYRPRFPFLIHVPFPLLKQFAKGYVLRGQGQTTPFGNQDPTEISCFISGLRVAVKTAKPLGLRDMKSKLL